MENKIASVHLWNLQSPSHKRVQFDRRSEDLRQGHLRCYSLSSELRMNRIMRVLQHKNASFILYQHGFTCMYIPGNYKQPSIMWGN
jgi:hypothetical protein